MNETAIRVATEIASGLDSQGSFFSRLKGQSSGEPLETKILRQINVLNHHDRSQVAVMLGQLSSRVAQPASVVQAKIGSLSKEGKISLETALQKMESGEFYQRRFALYSVLGSKDTGKVERALADRSGSIRSLAARIAATVLPDRELAEVVLRFKDRDRRLSLKRLRSLGRVNAIDAFLIRLKPLDPDAYSRFLPYGSEAFLGEMWPGIEQRLSIDGWKTLARNHTGFCLDKLEAYIKSSDKNEPRILLLTNAVLPITGGRPFAKNMSIVDLASEGFPLERIALGKLVRLRSRDVAEIVLRKETTAPCDLSPIYKRLGIAVASKLIRKHPQTSRAVAGWLKKFRPEERGVLWGEFRETWKSSDGIVDPALIRLLPGNLRVAEARAQLKLSILETRPEQRLPYAEFLPWEESRNELSEYLNDPAPEGRILGLTVLLRGLRYQGERVTEALEFLRTRKHEQDPLRLAVFNELAQLPPSIFKAEHQDLLRGVIRDGLDARDLSSGTVQFMLRFLLRLLQSHGSWGAAQFAEIVKERGYPLRDSFESLLGPREIALVADAVTPILRTWHTKENEGFIVAFGRNLGKHLTSFPEIESILESLAKSASQAFIAESALALLRQNRKRYGKVVQELLLEDGSWSTRRPVLQFLHEQRQDLLTPYLGQNAYTGKFATGKVRIVPTFQDGFERWTSEQKQIYQTALTSFLEKKNNDTSDLFYGLTNLSRLPDPPVELFVKYSNLTEPDKVIVRDFAISCLPRLDAGEGVPELVNCLEDERARIAIYSLRSAILRMDPDAALQLLKNVPRKKGTVLKEVVRLAGELRSANALQFLLQLCRENHGRDVRTALLRALWDYLEHEETWLYFTKEAEGNERAIARHLGRIPSSSLSEYSGSRLSALLASLLDNPDAKVRLEVLQRLTAQPVSDRQLMLKDRLVRSLSGDARDESDAAASAIVETYGRSNPRIVEDIVLSILTSRRSLSILCAKFCGRVQSEGKRLHESAKLVMHALEKDPLLTNLRLSLSIQTSPIEELIQSVETNLSESRFHAGNVQGLIQLLPNALKRDDASDIRRLFERWNSAEREELRRLALAVLITECDGRSGWSDGDLAALRTFRNDPSPFVASVAQFTFPPNELERPSLPNLFGVG